MVQARAIKNKSPKMARICLFAVCSKRDFLMGVALKGGGEMKHHPAMGNLKRYFSP